MKKALAFLMAAVMLMSMLTACGNKDVADDTKDNNVSTTEANQATADTKDSSDAPTADADQAAADEVAALIDAIYVQARTEETDAQCEAAKAAWDALTDAQKALVEGEEASPDYFGLDTGDASKDDPRNQDEIGEKELLVVSFGTSFNDSRVADIKSIEDALQEANPDWSVRRAFTAQIIINHIQARDGEKIDNMEQALERAVANGVKQLVVQRRRRHQRRQGSRCQGRRRRCSERERLRVHRCRQGGRCGLRADGSRYGARGEGHLQPDGHPDGQAGL